MSCNIAKTVCMVFKPKRSRMIVDSDFLLFQHVVQPTRQRGSDMPHTLDLIITSDNFLTDIEYLSPLGMSDHSVLKFSLQMFVDRVSADDKFRWDSTCLL